MKDKDYKRIETLLVYLFLNKDMRHSIHWEGVDKMKIKNTINKPINKKYT